MRALIGDEGAHTRYSHQYAIGRQLAERAVGRHTGDIQLAHQFVLGGHALPDAQSAIGDLAQDELLHLQISRGGLRLLGHPRSLALLIPACLYRLRAPPAPGPHIKSVREVSLQARFG